MKERFFENNYAQFWLEDNVVYFIYKPGTVLNIDSVKTIVDDRKNFQQGVSYPVFCDARGLKDSDKQARDYLAKEGSDLVIAVAVLTGSPVTRIMVNFYLTISKPITPTKLFTDQDQAIAYLQKFKTLPVEGH
jgi:hypothetical protein